MTSPFDTIVAISTPLGVGAIGIVRLSGDLALEIARQLFHPSHTFESHRVYLGDIQIPPSKEKLDQSLLIFMKAPHSYTGEDVIEFHCHGNPFILRTVLHCCLQAGARLAEKGEFSRRAFLNGKLDLTQAEAVGDLIHRQGRQGLQQALGQLEGHLSTPIYQMRQCLLDILVALEGNIDFPDEIEPPSRRSVFEDIEAVQAKIDVLLASADVGKIWREGIRLAIVGRPNVGKSSLLNCLLRYERAIVTEVPGTTRDTVEDSYNLRGIPIHIIDTAGLRQTEDRIEKIGIERSQLALQDADVVLLVTEAASGLTADDEELLEQLHQRFHLLVFNKTDLASSAPSSLTFDPVLTSALQGKGIEELEARLYELITEHVEMDFKVAINERHKILLLRSQKALRRVHSTLQKNLPEDFLAIDLKEAVVALGEVVGEAVTEEVINQIFHRFCVGK